MAPIPRYLPSMRPRRLTPSASTLLPSILPLLLGTSACGTDDWCRRFNLDCVVEAELVYEPAVDQDGDLWPAGTDCDDEDPESHPSAIEVCDGRDNDCDGDVDEGTAGVREWYPDVDGDGFGAEVEPTLACEGTTGWTTTGGDCNDSDWSINPGADERCDEVDRDCDGDLEAGAVDAVTAWQDADGDGYGDPETEREACELEEGEVINGADCDDTRPEVFPFADERCNLRDDDCDTEIDEPGAVDPVETGYRDDDGDGYGDPDTATGLCGPADGYVLDDTDCDDRNEHIHPGAEECINGVDDDCDGEIDDDATPPPTWYADDDGDGYGARSEPFVNCRQPSGYVDNDLDCDDSKSGVNPDATEVCGASDDDCDGLLDDQDPSLDTSTTATWTTDGDGDGYGDPAGSSVQACKGPSGTVSNADDCDDEDATVYPGAPELCATGTVEDCDGTEADAEAACALEGEVYGAQAWARIQQTETGGQSLGSTLEAMDDLDGDGVGELLLTDYTFDNKGAVYLVSGSTSGAVETSEATATFLGEYSYDYTGSALAWLGTWGDDGTLAVGAYGSDLYASSGGLVYLLEGPFSGAVDLGDEAMVVVGKAANEQAGAALAGGGDLTGDGLEDLVVGAPFSTIWASSGGGAYIFEGPLSSDRYVTAADAAVGASASSVEAGRDLAVADLDGDGIAELAMGARYASFVASQGGAVWVMQGPLSGTLSTAEGARYDESSGGGYLHAVEVLEDFDGDGLSDLVLGAYRASHSSTRAGAAYVVLGPATAGGDLSSVAHATLLGADYGDGFGISVSSAGDVDGDDLTDLLVGSASGDVGAWEGAAYRFVGLGSGSVTAADAQVAMSPGEDSALTVLGGLDPDGDGELGFLVGGYQVTGDDGSLGGAVYHLQPQDH